MPDDAPTTLPCGCQVRPYRDFLGRGVGTVLARGAQCTRDEHEPGQTVLLPGRENARQE